ncbi:TIGR02611 family protein [Actinopolyspora saharensis]|uniref:TIGR02611 family protein n=1 Tax=Actinopolyspora saharensis TaxID=995062 RepID=A0A1H0Y268_9ACTN|nr:TIGR02611 family protein [Actinopolyspora saharensis]SDQ09151.1 TIGR02611 family protein [Actinopolyspora saharensis]
MEKTPEAGRCVLSRTAGPDSRQNRATPQGSTSSLRTRLHELREHLRARRERIRARRGLNALYRFTLGLTGGLVLVVGIVMIPYPGPGWLCVFAGLGLLATEFAWAHQVNMFAKHHYQRWVGWLSRQHLLVKLAVMATTCLIVLATLWLIGAFALVGNLFGLDWPWLTSPLFSP